MRLLKLKGTLFEDEINSDMLSELDVLTENIVIRYEETRLSKYFSVH